VLAVRPTTVVVVVVGLALARRVAQVVPVWRAAVRREPPELPRAVVWLVV
jgi:hypothetical protein